MLKVHVLDVHVENEICQCYTRIPQFRNSCSILLYVQRTLLMTKKINTLICPTLFMKFRRIKTGGESDEWLKSVWHLFIFLKRSSLVCRAFRRERNRAWRDEADIIVKLILLHKKTMLSRSFFAQYFDQTHCWLSGFLNYFKIKF